MTEIRQIPDLNINIQTAGIRDVYIPETRNWVVNPPLAIPPTVPVTENIGSPAVSYTHLTLPTKRIV